MNVERLNEILKAGILILAGSLIFSLAVAQAVVVLLVPVWIVKLVLQRKIKLKSSPSIYYPFLFFIAARIFSVLFSTDFSNSVVILYKEIFFYFLFFIVVDVFPVEDKKYLKTFFGVLVLAALTASIFGTLKVLLGFADRASSTTSGYSTLGMFLTVITAVLLALGNDSLFRISKLVWDFFLIVIVTGILFTFNRTHWGIIGLIVFLVGLFRDRKIVLTIALLSAVLIVAVPVLRERFYQLIFFANNLSDRDTIWQGAGMIFFEHPVLGFGPKTFREIFPLLYKLKDADVSSWHCDYLQVYMESGILGLVAFLWLAASIFYFGVRLFKNQNIRLYKEVTLAVILGITCFYLTAIVGGFIFDPISSLLFQLLIGILVKNQGGNLNELKR